MVTQVCKEAWDQLDPWDLQEGLGPQALLVRKVNKGCPDQLVPADQLVFLELQGLPDQKAVMVQMDFQDHLDHLDHQDFQVTLVQVVQLVILDLWGKLVTQALLDYRVLQDQRVQMGFLDLQDHKVIEVYQVVRDR